MLSKKRRINKDLFEEIIKQGKNIHSDDICLRYVKNGNDVSRFSFVISSKICKKAVGRNLFKRRGRHIIKKIEKDVADGFVCAFFAKKGAIEIPFVELEKQIISLLNKAKVLR